MQRFNILRQWSHDVSVIPAEIEKIKDGMDSYISFVSSLEDSEKKILRAVKTRANFVSCILFCTMAVDAGIEQDKINTALQSFFNGKPSISDDYNRTVGSGSAKPTAVKTRKDIILKMVDEIPTVVPF